MAAGGYTVFPALWGPRSFNIGAGMARLDTAAAFVKAKMPMGGVALSDDEAYDVAAYFTRQPRPDFKAKSRDWPNGHKPRDARY
jgi:thiosulfate dehydrogenase